MGAKKVLGLDIGTNSIGWAVVHEHEENDLPASIEKIGVRVIPITTEEQTNFEQGKSFSVNQERTNKRGARRSLQRYKLRRRELLKVLRENGLLNADSLLTEHGKGSTYQLWQQRARAAEEQISLESFARVLLAMNKKRGYRSNRKAKDKDKDNGQVIDGMVIAKILYEKNLTPGQYVHARLSKENKHVPDFYPSDLQNEFDRIWSVQQQFYPQLIDELKIELLEKNKNQTWAILKEPFGLKGISLFDESGKKLKGFEEKQEFYRLRTIALQEQLEPEKLAIVLQQINSQKNGTSGYLGAISDRSKELFFNNQTIGQWGYQRLQQSIHNRLKGQVFYRQDYLDEFEVIWEKQASFYPEVLTPALKQEIRDVVIFYQRPLRSQKGLISVCELEGRTQEIICKRTGKTRKRLTGPRVIPKSNPLFQQFKIWQTLNNLEFLNKDTGEIVKIAELDQDLEIRQQLAGELDIKGKLTEKQLLKIVFAKPAGWESNFTRSGGIDGNRTGQALFDAYKEIIELTNEQVDFNKDSATVTRQLSTAFTNLGIDPHILTLDTDLQGQKIEQQTSWQLWHLLYSYAGDKSASGNDALYKKLEEMFGFKKEYGELLAAITLQDDYGSLSSRAIRKILPFMKSGNSYSEACELVGYRHSNWVTGEENQQRELHDKLEILPKNNLRNPVVEKILNQMVHMVNTIIDTYGKPDEVRIELARELKKTAKERDEMTRNITAANKRHDKIRTEISKLPQFAGGVRITHNDIVKYKLWQELENNGFKTLYSDTFVAKEELFSRQFDIEHIIPKALLFDDSFSNKTLELVDVNRKKSNQTAVDFIADQSMSILKSRGDYEAGILYLYKNKYISKAKRDKLLMPASKLGDGFIERDLRNSQYIAKKAQEMLREVIRDVVATTGSITARLRQDWQLVDVMKEINFPVYEKLGLTNVETNKNGQKIRQISDWSKRNDQRHHAMDALTIAFTRRAYIQYLNHLNARRDESHKKHQHIFAIENKYTCFDEEKRKRLIKPPMPLNELRKEFKAHLQNVLVSYKAKNKVVTKNLNRSKKQRGYNQQQTLTPRGQLHKEMVYGQSRYYVSKEEKVSARFDNKKIAMVANAHYRDALQKRLQQFDNNPKKAFSGKNAPVKNPVYVDDNTTTQLPEKVKLVWMEDRFTIREEITPKLFRTDNKDNFLKLKEKIVDKRIKKLIEDRYNLATKEVDEFNRSVVEKKEKKKVLETAFGNLEENPIWQNKEKGIAIKRVTITGVSNARPLHYQYDHHGKLVRDEHGEAVPVDFVQTGNNHHIAIYEDDKGNWHEQCVSFYEVVERVQQGLPVIDKHHNQDQGWTFLFSMKQNEMFIFSGADSGFNPHNINVEDDNNNALISKNLFRVQKISSKYYVFRHHLETVVQRQTKDNKKVDEKGLQDVIWKYFQSTGALKESNPIKVRLNHLGRIVQVGES